jgi:hypothetical protein
MSSSIRLTTSGVPDTPPTGYVRLFVDVHNGVLYLKMRRPDGSIQVFGTINMPLDVVQGGTGTSTIPAIGQFLIGTGTGYRVGDIVAGNGITITKTATDFEIDADLSDVELVMPAEFTVTENLVTAVKTITVSKNVQDANKVYAGPASSSGIPVFRFLQVADIPDLPTTKITNLIATIQAESYLDPVDSADIDHTYNSTTKTLSSTIKPTTVVAGSYGNATTVPNYTVKADGRLEFAGNTTIAIPHTQVTDFTEATQDVVGALIVDTDSINVDYSDALGTLSINVNQSYLITTNISASENQRAPTSQAIKQYVDDNVDGERTARIAADALLIPLTQKGAANGVATLDATGKVPTSQLPASASGVSSVNTKTGDVVLVTDDISEDGSPVNLWFTDNRAQTAAVVNSSAGTETNKAMSVSAAKAYTDNAVSAEATLRSNADALLIPLTQKGAINGVATLDATGKVPTSQLPTGSSAVTSVNTKTGDVVLVTDDISEDGSPVNLWFTNARAQTAAVVNSTAGSETVQAASVSAMKTYVTNSVVTVHNNLTGRDTAGAHPATAITVTGGSDLQSFLNGLSSAPSFETVSKNLSARPYTLNYTSGVLTSIVYDLGGGQSITKTLGYTSGALTSVTLSGNTPGGITLVKTLTYTSGTLTGISYS